LVNFGLILDDCNPESYSNFFSTTFWLAHGISDKAFSLRASSSAIIS